MAMYYVCLKTLRVDSTLNPIREFWNGFRMNFKQAFLGFLGFLVIAAILILDIMFVARTQGSMRLFRYPVYVVSGIMLLILFHVIPVMAAFADTLKGLIRNGIYFLWATFGFSSIAMICSGMLLKDFEQYLPSLDISEDEEADME